MNGRQVCGVRVCGGRGSRLLGPLALWLAYGVGPACVSDPGPSEDPMEDEGPPSVAAQLGRLCSATLDVVGAFEEGAPQPVDVFGCWPVGTWRFEATVVENGCEAAPELESEYAFSVARDAEEAESYVYLTDPANRRLRIKVKSGGGGLCEGGLELFSSDGKAVLNLKPALQADRTITGFGEYDEYAAPQWEE